MTAQPILQKNWAAQLDDYLIALAYSPDSQRLAALSSAGTLSLFDTGNSTRHHLPAHENGADTLAWLGNTTLATGGQDNLVKFWDAPNAQHTGTSTKQKSPVTQLLKIPNQPQLAAAAGKTLLLLNPDGTSTHTFPELPKTISHIAISPDAQTLAVATFSQIQTYKLPATGNPTAHELLPTGTSTTALLYSPDNRWLVSGNGDSSVILWQTATAEKFRMSGFGGKIDTLAFSPDSTHLATGASTDICIWDCRGPGPEGREPQMLSHDAKITALAFANNSTLATASADGNVQIFLLKNGTFTPALSMKLPAGISTLTWSPDARHLAIGTSTAILYTLQKFAE